MNAANNAIVPVIDAHCDALLAVVGDSQIPGDTGNRDFLVRNELSHIDLPKLKEGGLQCQFMALFTESAHIHNARAWTHRLIDEFQNICAASGGDFFPVLKAADLDRALPGHSVGALLSIEGAEALNGSLDELDVFYARGVRALGITWSRRNPFGRGVGVEGTDGLSPLGKDLVRRLETKGILVDVSHLSDEAFDDLVQVASGPIIASHSNARALQPHLRNLTDAQIRTIAASGGAVGAVFVPGFIASPPVDSYLERLCDHIMHIIKVGGIECAAMGSDFDGYRGVEGNVIRDASEYQRIPLALAARGLDDSELRAVMSGNWRRVLQAVLA